MGRRSSSKGGSVPYFKNPDVFKSRHRFSDTKYRHNVQYFYDLLRQLTDENLTKDTLLQTVSKDIQNMRNDIIYLAGSQKLGKMNAQFLEIAEIGENIWKKVKNPVEWYSQMKTVLDSAVNENSLLDIQVKSPKKTSKLSKYRKAI